MVSDVDGRVVAFEVENAYIRLPTVVRLLQQTRGVADVRRRKNFASADDVRVEFTYLGTPFVVCEPFGDNSRYWIGPAQLSEVCVDPTVLVETFGAYRVPLHHQVVGDLLSLRLTRQQTEKR